MIYVRKEEKVEFGDVRVLYVPSRYQIADIFTKGLSQVLFNDFDPVSASDCGGVIE